MSSLKTRENRLRRKAARLGLQMSKSRRRDPDAMDYGMYALANSNTGGIIHEVIVFPHCLTLEDVGEWLDVWTNLHSGHDAE